MEETSNTGNTIAKIMLVGILFVVLLLSLVIVIDVVTNANTSLNGKVYTNVAVINETGYINSTGYTLSGSTATGFKDVTLTALFNRTSGLSIALGNATVSAAGVVTNASSTLWNNASISYTYNYDTTTASTQNVGFTSIQSGVILMVTNFFALMPTVGTILAVVILIGGIILLVFYVKRMSKSSSDTSEFQG